MTTQTAALTVTEPDTLQRIAAALASDPRLRVAQHQAAATLTDLGTFETSARGPSYIKTTGRSLRRRTASRGQVAEHDQSQPGRDPLVGAAHGRHGPRSTGLHRPGTRAARRDRRPCRDAWLASRTSAASARRRAGTSQPAYATPRSLRRPGLPACDGPELAALQFSNYIRTGDNEGDLSVWGKGDKPRAVV